MKRVVIDARPLSRNKGGIQRYLEQTLPFIIADESFEVTLYMDDKPNQHILSNFPKVKNIFFPKFFQAFNLNKLMWNFWVLFRLLKDKPDIYWSPRHHLPIFLPQECKAVVTIHDMVWKTCPETMPKIKRLTEAILMPISLNRANKIIAVSNTTKLRIREYFSNITAEIYVIKHGISFEAIDYTSNTPNNFSDYFLAVGTLEPRKNYVRLLLAFDQYINQGGKKNLIIVGKKGWKTSAIFYQLKRNLFNNKVKLLSNVDDDQLKLLYRDANGLIMVSLDEGFGLPPLEANFFSVPRMLSDIEIFRELYPNAEVWADPHQVTDITEKLFSLEKAKAQAQYKDLVESLPNWEQSAYKLIKVMKS